MKSTDENSNISEDINLDDTCTASSSTHSNRSNLNNVELEDLHITILDGNFFEKVCSKSIGGKVVSVCKKYAPNYTEIKGSKNYIKFCNPFKKEAWQRCFGRIL